MFDDEKIRLIESMPDADAVLVIWIKLLVQAGRTNANGYIFLNENIPYTDEMLATIFNRPLNTVRLALNTFKDFGMIEWDGNGICINNWDKHQNIEGLDKIREQNRLRQAKYREKQKMLPDSNATVTLHNGTDLDLDLELERDKEKDVVNDSNNSDAKFKKIVKAFNNNIHPITPMEADTLSAWLEDGVEAGLIVWAIKQGVVNGKRNARYIDAIIRNLTKEGITTLAGAEAKERNREDRKEKSRESPTVLRCSICKKALKKEEVVRIEMDGSSVPIICCKECAEDFRVLEGVMGD